ncbi:uncharacterized protein BP5553_00369 [Venustampulla echinocandica]|uniref:Uncharacterized protein n=1 Tax=Venustampulla echinocandica TaxID=2656787 RepID=A0A370TXZ7_9HELO|nr:uncharacterized protein BP5553_00369 [Venustampulla echinocandica]RDL40390.1 hypothetical protein BP5553_00369 [Venustampulla echinocandica]
MAGTISRITAALASVHNENAVSLANLNFDFTLVKLEAPREYNALGETISRTRKVDAEEGALHKTARKLGALFKETLPPAEELFKAYGTRASEISAMPSINPRGKEGIFASHVGADTASIWAAATSGSSAISAHLLGCMLARMFTGPEAISVWVEIVQKQKECISIRQGERLYSEEHQADCMAVLQEISRAELASWDASARAWLQSADEAKPRQQKQTMLILDNASIPVNNEPDTYTSVMKAWTAALEAMNNLARGMPQTVQDGAALLAISSWHLYPDMAVYGGPVVQVKQKDPIFQTSALLTLGLQHLRDDKKSVYWSLPLACLQHYGYPIRTSRSAGSETARITYQQFAYIIIGCLFVGWKEFALTNEEGLQWLQRLGCILQLPKGRLLPRNPLDPNHPTWLHYILNAAHELDDCEDSEKKAALQLMNLGRRRSTFLYANSRMPPPLFGLSSVPVLLSVLKIPQRIQLLRECCTNLKLNGTELNGDQIVIGYSTSEEEDDKIGVDYASVFPIPRPSSKRMRDGSAKYPKPPDSRHRRWITLSHAQVEICYRRREDFIDIPRTLVLLKRYKEAEKFYSQERSDSPQEAFTQLPTRERQHRLDEITELSTVVLIAQRRKLIEDLGEDCLPVMDWYTHSGSSYCDTALIFSLEREFLDACGDILDACGDILVRCEAALRNPTADFGTFYAGDRKTAALYSMVPFENSEEIILSLYTHLTPSLKCLESFFSTENFNMKNLYDQISNQPSCEAREELRCLQACAMMADIYKLLPGATISTLIVGQSMRDAKWIPRPIRQVSQVSFTVQSRVILPSHLRLPQAFACVAMFESGTCNIDPSYLSEAFAMSSGNSLYVAAALLCDPYDEPQATELRRVVGNIGRSGITFLISPPELKTRGPDPEKWMSINHRAFDGNLEDHFRETSMHLSFTQYEIPLLTESNPHHIIDRSAVLLESLISVFEGGTWVAEVDVLKAVRNCSVRTNKWGQGQRHHHSNDTTVPNPLFATYSEALNTHPKLAATSVENWDELIEAPSTGLIAIRGA